MAESYFGTHLCKLTTCLCWPLFQERSVVNLGFTVLRWTVAPMLLEELDGNYVPGGKRYPYIWAGLSRRQASCIISGSLLLSLFLLLLLSSSSSPQR